MSLPSSSPTWEIFTVYALFSWERDVQGCPWEFLPQYKECADLSQDSSCIYSVSRIRNVTKAQEALNPQGWSGHPTPTVLPERLFGVHLISCLTGYALSEPVTLVSKVGWKLSELSHPDCLSCRRRRLWLTVGTGLTSWRRQVELWVVVSVTCWRLQVYYLLSSWDWIL